MTYADLKYLVSLYMRQFICYCTRHDWASKYVRFYKPTGEPVWNRVCNWCGKVQKLNTATWVDE